MTQNEMNENDYLNMNIDEIDEIEVLRRCAKAQKQAKEELQNELEKCEKLRSSSKNGEDDIDRFAKNIRTEGLV